MENPKSEIRNPKEGRNPKPEGRKNSEFRIPNSENAAGVSAGHSDFGIWISFGFRISDFGFPPVLCS